MNLTVITGYREYLLPRAADPAGLLEVLRAIEPRAMVPALRWERDGKVLPYHTFLYEEDSDRDRRVDLFLEFSGDLAGPDDTVFVILPYESAVDPAGRGPTLAHPRVRHFVGRARACLGDATVSCRRLFLSDNSQAVLQRLEAMRRGEPERPSRTRDASARGADHIVTSVALDRLGTTPAVFSDLHRNYGRTLLALGEEIVARESIFAGTGRAALVAELLDHNQLFIRAELTPERVAAELRAGGELFELLTKPLPPMPSPQLAPAMLEAAAPRASAG